MDYITLGVIQTVVVCVVATILTIKYLVPIAWEFYLELLDENSYLYQEEEEEDL